MQLPPDVLRVIATVLDFNAEDRNKSGLEGGGGRGWLRQGSSSSSSAALDQSLAQAFVQFLVSVHRWIVIYSFSIIHYS